MGNCRQSGRMYSKEEIIAMYLNQFDFLNNAVGIKSAAHVYFNTTADKLKIEEAATLIGMCKKIHPTSIRYGIKKEQSDGEM